MNYDETIKQLINLKGHCKDWVDTDDPENIWQKDIDALDAAVYALSALCNAGETGEKFVREHTNVDAQNESKKEGKTMEKSIAKVTIETADGKKQVCECGTAVCFMTNYKNFEPQTTVAVHGLKIPDPVVYDVLTAGILCALDGLFENRPGQKAYACNRMAEVFSEKEKEFLSQISLENVGTEFSSLIDNLFDTLTSGQYK